MRVTLKLATSLDGKIATATGESRWITGPEAREAVHRLRLAHMAVMIGVETAIADDPELTVRLPGPAGRVALGMAVDGFHARGIATDHDVTVSGALADVLTGGETDYLDPMTEEDVMALERKAFMALIRTKETQARIKSIIDTGKPLRN